MERSNEAEGDGVVNNRKSLVVSRRELFEHLNAIEPTSPSKSPRVVGKLAASACNSDADDTDSRRGVNSNCVNSSDNNVSGIDVNANQPEDRTAAPNEAEVDEIEDEDKFAESVTELKLPPELDSAASKRISYNIAVSKGHFGKFPAALTRELSIKINAINEKRGGDQNDTSSDDDTNSVDDASDRVRLSDVDVDQTSTNESPAVVAHVHENNNEDLSKAKLTDDKLSVISSSRITDNRECLADGQSDHSEKDKQQDYPEELNPFGDDDENAVVDQSVSTNPFDSETEDETEDKKDEKSVENAKISTNPFWSGSEDEEENDATSIDSTSLKKTPVPLPRTIKTPIQTPQQGSSTTRLSNSDVNHDESTCTTNATYVSPSPAPSRRSLQTSFRKLSGDSLDVSFQRSPASRSVNSTLRKKKPAPPPPSVATSVTVNNANNDNQNSSNEQITNTDTAISAPPPRKVVASPWKNKKGPAPPRPIPIRRPVKEMPLEDIKTEISDIEIRQQELERQSKQVEEMIRDKTNIDDTENSSCSSEELVLQLFELVNEKNELLRRRSELMYMRKMHNLEEEQAEMEYQYRCLTLKPESNKTDSDKAREEELLKRILEAVEKRNEIVEAMDKDRQRETAEDESVTTQLEPKNIDSKDDKAKKPKKSKKDKIKEHKEEDGDKHDNKHSPSKVIKQKFMTLSHSVKKLNSKLPH